MPGGFHNNSTFPSFSDSVGVYSSSGDSYYMSEGDTFSLDDQDKLSCAPFSDIAQRLHKTGDDYDGTSVSTNQSKMSVYNVLEAIDKSVDAVVDVVIPLEKNISNLFIEPSPPNTSSAPIVHNAKLKSKQAKKKTRNMSQKHTSPRFGRSLSPLKRKANKEKYNKNLDTADEERDDVSMLSIFSTGPMVAMFSSPTNVKNEEKAKKKNKSSGFGRSLSPLKRKANKEKYSKNLDTADEERDDVSMLSIFSPGPMVAMFSSPTNVKNEEKAKKKNKSTKRKAIGINTVQEEDGQPSFFDSAYQWISPKQELVIEKKKFFGRNRSKKTSKTSQISGNTMKGGSKKDYKKKSDTPAMVEERDANEESARGKKRGLRFWKKKEIIVDKKIEHDWWTSFLWAEELKDDEKLLPKLDDTNPKGLKKIFNRKETKGTKKKKQARRRKKELDKKRSQKNDGIVNE